MADICTVLADVTEIAHEEGQFDQALDELAVRVDLIGAGPLLDTWAKKRIKRQRLRRRWHTRNRPD